jgi:hypothetical protein
MEVLVAVFVGLPSSPTFPRIAVARRFVGRGASLMVRLLNPVATLIRVITSHRYFILFGLRRCGRNDGIARWEPHLRTVTSTRTACAR